MSLSIKDIEHIKKFQNSLSSNIPIHIYNATGYGVGNQYCRIVIHSQHMVDTLKQLGVIEQKSNILRPSAPIPEKFTKDFIRGCFDGDGSVWKQGNNDYMIDFVGTVEMLEYIQNELIKNNIISHKYNFSKRKPEQSVMSFKFGGNIQVKKFITFIYKDANLYLNRKYNFSKYNNLINGLPT